MKKFLIIIGVLLVVIVAVIFIVARVFYPDNIAETSIDGGKKGLQTRFYKTDLETAEKAAKEIIPTLSTYGSNWKIVEESENDGIYTIKAEIPVVMFNDDLEIKIQKADNLHEVRINIVSKSRVGQSDFGENARHVRKVLDALDKKFGKN